MWSSPSTAMAKVLLAFGLLICGAFAALPFMEERILGGSAAYLGQYPYQVSLQLKQTRQHFCGASIISTNWILTAASCVQGKAASTIMIVVGTNSLTSGGLGYDVSSIVIHEKYNANTKYHNIALLKTSRTITFGTAVRGVALTNGAFPTGIQCTLTGWGLTNYPSQVLPANLQQVNLTSLSLPLCQRYLPNYPINGSNICTLEQVGKGACDGDTGGPLVCRGEQHGIVSWGIPCAKGNPDVYTSVYAYRSWIRTKAKV